MADTSQYFAAKEGIETAGTLMIKARSFYNVLEANAYLEKLARMWRAYHGAYDGSAGLGHQISFTGEEGELVKLPVNHFRNIAQHIYVMITANRPIMEARAINSDYKSMAQTYLANGILDYYMREKGLETCLKRAAEMAVVLGSGFIKLEWNANAGDIYDVAQDGSQIKEGEIEFSNLSPFDVVFDGTKENWNHDWLLVRTFQNRFNLMAKYPEFADKLKGMEPKNDGSVYRLAILSNDDTDDIPVYEFFHKKTDAMPNGRYMLFASADCVLMDIPMPYRSMPVFRISAGDILGTPYGYSPMFDIFPIQEGLNALYSTVMTNQSAFGVQNLWVPRGSDLTVSSLEGGMNIVEGNAKPEPLALTATAPEIFKFMETLIQAAETISGVNSVARGNPEASLKSGTALALVQSMALQFISGLQQSYVKLVEDVGTSLIQTLKDYANTPKLVALVGKNNKSLLKEFTGEDLNSINRVVVDIGNPLSRTIAGRVQMAEQMLQMNLIKEPTQYFQVINTGRLDVMFEGEVSQQLLVRQENEMLSDGRKPLVAPTDIHALHIQEHRSVLDDSDIRQDANLVKSVIDHIEDHLNALRNTDPGLLQITGQQPLPPLQPPVAPMPPPPGAMNSGPPGQPPHPGMQGSSSQILSPVAGQAGLKGTIQGPGVHGINLPNIPHPPAPFQHNPVTLNQMINK